MKPEKKKKERRGVRTQQGEDDYIKMSRQRVRIVDGLVICSISNKFCEGVKILFMSHQIAIGSAFS